MSSQRRAQPAHHPARQSSANMSPTRPNPQQYTSSASVSFQPIERGDRAAPIQTRYPQYHGATKDQPLPPTPQELMHDADEETAGGAFGARVGRKKSLVKPDREKIEPGHRQWYYRNHVAQMENEGRVMPSSMFSM
jgi:chitin synthase